MPRITYDTHPFISGTTASTGTWSNYVRITPSEPREHAMPEPQDELPYLNDDFNDHELLNRYGMTRDFDWGAIRSYSSNVLDHCTGFLKMPNEPQTNLFFGVEYEILALLNPEYPLDTLVDDVLSAFNGQAIVVRDGSINNGFEIVTVPASLNYHKETLWHTFFTSNLTKRLAGTAGCGNHIHVSKNAWTPLSVGKLLAFVNDVDNKELVDSIAGRSQGSYCTRHPAFSKPSAILKGNFSRTQAINIGPRETIEFRLFKTSINPVNLFKNLEFIDAIRHFTFNHKIGSMNSETFLAFVAENHSLWPYLVHFLNKEEWLIIEKPEPNNKRIAA